MQTMSERVESWIHDVNADDMDFNKLEERMDPDIMDEVYELERCIECGCCVSACATKRMRPDFFVRRGFSCAWPGFIWIPGTSGPNEEFYEIMGDDDGIFGCMTLLG